ncbi:MAG TPA: superoxide dismutase [Acidimicrobiia bacterium]|nr:superoxide dismutase [Acidimicrobiia bacterium]
MKPYVLPDLAYDYGALEPHYSARVLELHHSKHHAGYVKGVNDTLDKLAAARESNDMSTIVGLEKTLAFNLSGHVLHTLFWRNLAPDAGGRPDGELAAALDEHFGGFDAFKAQMSEAAGTVQGSGWGALSWEPLGERLYIEQVYDHQGNVGQSGVPLLVIDAWEHAYYLQYENRRPEYVAAIWNVIDWTDVAARFDRARALEFIEADAR